MKPPIAKKVPKTFEIHGDIRHDEYYWMNEKTNPEVLAHLEAENQFFKHILNPLNAQIEEYFEDMVARIPAEEKNVPLQKGPYYYYIRQEKELQYPIYARKLATTRDELEHAVEEIILDENVLANGNDYYSITDLRISDDHRYIAYLENLDGTDSSTLYIKDLQTNTLLDDVIPNVYLYGSIEWSKESDTIFYVSLNEIQRPDKLWRHKIGTTISSDELLIEEKDVTFNLYISKSQSTDYIFAFSNSTTTTEVQYLESANPTGSFKVFQPRKVGVEYEVEHWNDDFYIKTNEDALNFKLLKCPIDDITNLSVAVPYNEAFFIEGIYPFRKQLYVTGRSNGVEQIWRLEDNTLTQLEWDEDVYSVYLVGDQSYDAQEILIQYQSFVTPKTTYAISVETSEKQLIQITPITGDYIPENYVQQQLWATASDGVQVPVILQYHKDALVNGPAPLILDAYGSYGANSDPFFNPFRLPMLNRGIIFATAQVRGGSELGRTWYFDGKMQNKRNTFTDYIAVADLLIEKQYTTTDQLIGRGGSAGGLLIGAVANMAGEKFKVLVPEVPFVDVMTTMLDETIPLTTSEWDEWGNPKIEEDYLYMRSYSPYDNVEAKNYPHMYVTTGLNDPRVGYFEPAKWVARLRELKTDNHTLVFKINMGAGHYGASGRKNQLRELAEFYAFVLDKVGYSSSTRLETK